MSLSEKATKLTYSLSPQYRIFRAMIYQLWLQPTQLPARGLFKFMITPSHTSLWETDYNLHKSNSTYFSDFDIARTHLVSAILRRGILGVGKREGEESTTWSISTALRRSDRGTASSKKADALPAINALGTSGLDTTGGASTPQPPLTTRNLSEEEFMEIAAKPGNLLIALGSVACFFHREVPPYRKYEIWTRLLTWDRKWMYLVSYFVEAGAFKPDDFFLQPWKNGKGKSIGKDGETLEQRKQRIKGKVYATSLATYVVKKGRLTIPPEIVLQRSDMLPVKPPGASSAFHTPTTRTETGTPNPESTANGDSTRSHTVSAASVASVLEESLFPEAVPDGAEWTWDMVEKERQRGLKYAQVFDGLSVLREEFDGGEGGVLGVYTDLLGSI
jgi:hypothetical protein